MLLAARLKQVVARCAQSARHPACERLTVRLDRIMGRSEELTGLARLTRAFTALLRERRGDELRQWVEAVVASGIAELVAFARGLEQDWAAVVAGLTLEWSSGQVEGQVNRVKLNKRQMFGRAKFDLLRQRVLR